MGCCCSSNAEDIYEDGESNDRRNLLGSPDGESTRGPKYSTENEKFNHSIEKIDEQGKLNKILQETANNYIDVPALNSPMEQPGCSETEVYYAARSQEVLDRHTAKDAKVSLLSSSLRLEKVLGDVPLPATDRVMVNELSASVSEATSTIKVDYTENIIIPFNG